MIFFFYFFMTLTFFTQYIFWNLIQNIIQKSSSSFKSTNLWMDCIVHVFLNKSIHLKMKDITHLQEGSIPKVSSQANDSIAVHSY